MFLIHLFHDLLISDFGFAESFHDIMRFLFPVANRYNHKQTHVVWVDVGWFQMRIRVGVGAEGGFHCGQSNRSRRAYTVRWVGADPGSAY